MKINNESSFILDYINYSHVVRVCSRLYDSSRPLSPDERRDLAHVLDAVRESATEIPTDELVEALG